MVSLLRPHPPLPLKKGVSNVCFDNLLCKLDSSANFRHPPCWSTHVRNAELITKHAYCLCYTYKSCRCTCKYQICTSLNSEWILLRKKQTTTTERQGLESSLLLLFSTVTYKIFSTLIFYIYSILVHFLLGLFLYRGQGRFYGGVEG